MRNILKSIVTIAVLTVMVTGATNAYFTSTVTAEDNEITAGTLLLAVDTATDETSGETWGTDAWNVVNEDINGSVNKNGAFVTWDNAAPGTTKSYYVGMRNKGTLDMKVRFQHDLDGSEWFSGPRLDGETVIDGEICPVPEDAPADLVEITQVRQFASDNCEGDQGCENLYYALENHSGGWDHVDGVSAGNSSLDPDGWYYANVGASGLNPGTHIAFGEKQFSIYRVYVTLNAVDTDNCYQGATYHFDLTAEATQHEDESVW